MQFGFAAATAALLNVNLTIHYANADGTLQSLSFRPHLHGRDPPSSTITIAHYHEGHYVALIIPFDPSA